jgi:hypothetical protein
MLPIVTYERKVGFYDEQVRQLRNVRNPHDSIGLCEFEVDYSRRRARVKPIIPFPDS